MRQPDVRDRFLSHRLLLLLSEVLELVLVDLWHRKPEKKNGWIGRSMYHNDTEKTNREEVGLPSISCQSQYWLAVLFQEVPFDVRGSLVLRPNVGKCNEDKAQWPLGLSMGLCVCDCRPYLARASWSGSPSPARSPPSSSSNTYTTNTNHAHLRIDIKGGGTGPPTYIMSD